MSFKHQDIIYINLVFTDSFLLLELLNPPWLLNLSMERMWCISIARICKYHTHNHALSHALAEESVGTWQSRAACLGVALYFESRLLKWWRWQMVKTDCEISAQGRRLFFYKENKSIIQLVVFWLRKNIKDYLSIFILEIIKKGWSEMTSSGSHWNAEPQLRS